VAWWWWIEYNAVHDGIAGEADETFLFGVFGVLVHVDEHVVT
jgi:hypothetical protein